MSKEILKQNKVSWDIVAPHFNGVDALPNYGPFAQTEEELQLFEDIQGKKVLEIGYGSGHSSRLKGSYQEEGAKVMKNFKGEEVDMMIHKRKISTYMNQLIHSGFRIEEVIESEPGQSYDGIEAEVSDRYYSLYKARKFPATMIIKAGKR